ncbi:MAG: MotA/TolQ/ExbB proton channel family protein [Proteobacteria bacterium]|nr:MotA/TolQ/ExbB proton channel family protein [Pseudomonadota bacterium]MBI3498771.1 MotA/TolQ/ExbB proton channel family protein [Pseudomonadota bacterium]
MTHPATRIKLTDIAPSERSAAPPRRQVDLATFLGLTAGFGLMFAAMALGGSPSAFIDLPAALIVFGGTFAVTTVCFSLSDIARTQKAVALALVRASRDPRQAAEHVLELAQLARNQGVLVLERQLGLLGALPFLRRALSMVVDGASPEEVEHVMHQELVAIMSRHQRSASVLRRAAEVAPAMGLIGTLVGLVQMLAHLDNPAAIGPGMAVALLTTFYGAVLGNMLFAPLAAKLDRNSGEEALVNTIYLTAAASIGRQENPRRLEMLLNTLLPPDKRLRNFD